MRIALLTSSVNQRDALRVDGPLHAALERHGVTVEHVAWDQNAVNWDCFAAVVVRTTWNYQHAREPFLSVLDQIAAETRLVNPAPLIRWNTHKQYLVDLEEQGVPVIPTAVIPHGATVTLAEIAAARNLETLVIKPAVGAGGRDVSRGSVTLLAQPFTELLAAEDVVVQPYLPSVTATGELSVIVAGGAVTHAVHKLPPSGEFRAHERYGARYRSHTPTTGEHDLAVWVTEQLHPHTPTIARVDMVHDAHGTLFISEVELTEPNLYLNVVPAAADQIADRLIETVTTG